jgi:predicted nuclease of predicted toxin-antitoxin system
LKLKLDENIGRRGHELLVATGHDVLTVLDQQLHGVSDEDLFEICAQEGRAIITLDRDFGQVLRFPPEKSAGIIILDLGPRVTHEGLLQRLRNFVSLAESQSATGALWIVEASRVRIHLRDGDE